MAKQKSGRRSGTPIRPSSQGLYSFAKFTPGNRSQRSQLKKDMTQCYVGPMPVTSCLDVFTSASGASLELPKSARRVKFPSAARAEAAMYAPFFDTIERAQISPNIKFHITAHSHGGVPRHQLPDGGASKYPHRRQNHKSKSQKQPFDWHEHGLIVEFKSTKNGDPFHSLIDAKKLNSLEKTDPESRRTLGQLAGYVRESFNLQHRTHLFVLFIAGDIARIIRWDRAGAIVSDTFDYVKDPRPLFKFIWCYNQMTPAERGWDMSVSRPSPEENAAFHAAINSWIKRHGGTQVVKQRFPGAELTLDKANPTYKLCLQQPDVGQEHTLIIQRPYSQSYDIIGRANRTYLAYSMTQSTAENNVVFYKDCWRVEADDDQSETTAYKKLIDAGIEHISEILYAGDVIVNGAPLRTQTDVWARKSGVGVRWRVTCSSLRGHVLQRIVQPVAYPVQWLRSSREFVTILRDCSIAIGQAEKIGLLHRDISIGNVMAKFENDGQTFVGGMLNYWDNFGYVAPDSVARNVRRCGTWPFMSISILEDPTTRHTVMHDMESIYWVTLFGGYHYFDNNAAIVWETFYEKCKLNDPQGPSMYVGGTRKRSSLRSSAGKGFQTPAFRDLITTMGNRWDQYYIAEHLFFSCKECPEDATQRAQFVERVEALSKKRRKPGSLEQLAFNYGNAQRLASTPQHWIELMNQHLRDEATDAWPLDAVPDLYPRYEKKAAAMKDREDDIKSTIIFEAHQISASVDSEGLTTSDDDTLKGSKKRARDDILPSNSPPRPKKLRRIAHITASSKIRRSSRLSGVASTSVYDRSSDDGNSTSSPDSSSSSERSPPTSPSDVLGVRRSSHLATNSAPRHSTHAGAPSKKTRRTLRKS